MHPITHPRNALIFGIAFVIVGLIYWLVPYVDSRPFVDLAGTVMLVALGAAMAIMFYVLVAGSPRE
jgi:heme/copper-type cytochrome/quinol oxidase subunit 1